MSIIPPDSETVRSSDRALALLEAVIEADRAISLTEAAEAVDLPLTTTTRQLASLESAEMIERVAQGYRVGARMVRLAHRVVGTHSLQRLAQPILDELACVTGESSYLAVALSDDTAIYIAAAEGTHHLRHAGWRGRTVPRADTALGQALDGTGPVVVRDAVEDGITAISTPVTGADGVVAAAVSIMGPTFRLDGQTLERTRAQLHERAAQLSALLGAPDHVLPDTPTMDAA